MFNPTDELLPVAVTAPINTCNILQSFSKCDRLTVFLNNLFNTYDVYTLDKQFFFQFLKDMVKKKRLKRSDLSFFKHHKEDKVIKMVHSRFPHLKHMEVIALIDLVKKDEEVYPQFAETVGLEVPKKKKITKKQAAEFKKTDPPKPTAKAKPKAKVKSSNKVKPVVKASSFDAWKNGFDPKEN